MKNKFIDLIDAAFKKGIIKKLVFSRPANSEVKKVSARQCELRNRQVLALEYSLPGDTVSHKNVYYADLRAEVSPLMQQYKQANLITVLGDLEWKTSKSGKEVLLGKDALEKKLNDGALAFERAITSLDVKKNYILSGNEDFLVELGISDRNGRVHDKKQGKFRQINRFLEHIENLCPKLDSDNLLIYDLCCGKSYLSFAVYYYLTALKGKKVDMLCIDLKRDVIEWCASLKTRLHYDGMKFVCDDVTNTPTDRIPDMVISLHACDVATDIVLDTAIRLGAKVILSTPCCHRYMNDKIAVESLRFVTDFPHLRTKICEAVTDALRAKKLSANGYSVSVVELTDPENTPKNTLIRAFKCGESNEIKMKEYDEILTYLFLDKKDDYLKDILKN